MIKLKHILLFFYVFGCSTQQNESYLIELKEYKQYNLSEFIQKVELVKLQTTTHCLIGDISRVIVNRNRIYVFDINSSTLFLFNNEGDYINKMNKLGHGPGEYIKAVDFDIFDNKIYILDYTGKKILCYNEKFEFIKNIEVPGYASQFKLFNDKIILKCEYTSKSGTPYFVILNNNGKSLKSIGNLPEPGKYNWSGINAFCRTDSLLSYSRYFDNTVSLIDLNNRNVNLTIDFGDKNIPKDININNSNIFGKNFNYLFKYNYFIVENWFIADFFDNFKRYFFWVDIDKRKVQCGQIADDITGLPFYPKWSFNSGLIGAFPALDIVNIKLDNKDWAYIDEVSINDNPVLVLYHF